MPEGNRISGYIYRRATFATNVQFSVIVTHGVHALSWSLYLPIITVHIVEHEGEGA